MPSVFVVRRFLSSVAVVAVCCTLTATTLVAEDWLQWRGPGGLNIAAAGQAIPDRFGPNDHVIWQTEVPGRGHSSPVIIGDLVVLCTADEGQQIQSVVAFGRSSGKLLWTTSIARGGFPKLHPKNTHASSSVASDGQHIFAAFCHHKQIEVVALDLDGQIVWRKTAGRFDPKIYEYGYASSPTIFEETLIVSGECDTVSWITALALSDGQAVWSQERPKMLNWGSPIVASLKGRPQLLMSGSRQIASYDPANGQQLWSTPCLTMATCGTCIWTDDLVIASGGYPDPETAAVKADGSGLVWKNSVKCYEQSMLTHAGYIYAFSDQGIFYCWNASTGEEMWKRRLRGPVSASPLLVGDRIFAPSEDGSIWVIEATPDEFRQIARNRLGTSAFASIVAADNRLYIRTASGEGLQRRETLWCIGQK